jgi:hypothetical protein
MKMGRRLRCSSVTYRFRYAPLLPPVRLGPPCRRAILIATKAMLFMGQDTKLPSMEPMLSQTSREPLPSASESLASDVAESTPVL